MLSGDDKSVWPDPVSPGCIFTVSQGIAATVTACQAGEIESTERGTEGRREKDIGFFILCLLFSAKKIYHNLPLPVFPSYRGVQRWHLVSHDCGLFICLVRRESCDLFQSQLVSGRGGALGPAQGSTEA